MSELTTCNYCSLKRITESAKKQGKIVTRRNANGGVYIHVHGKDEPVDTTDWDSGNKQIVSWMVEISERCVC
jgi:hypothetical protein